MLSGGTLTALNRWLTASTDAVANARFLLETEGHDGALSDDSGDDLIDKAMGDLDHKEIEENIDGAQQLDEFGNPIGATAGREDDMEKFDSPFTLQLMIKGATGLPKAPIFGLVETYATVKWLPKMKLKIADEENIDNIPLVTQAAKGGEEVVWADVPMNIFHLSAQYQETLAFMLEEYDEDDDADGLIAEEMHQRKLDRQLDGCSVQIEIFNKPMFGDVVSMGVATVNSDALIETCYLMKELWVDVVVPSNDHRDAVAGRRVCIMGRVEEVARDNVTSQKLSVKLAAESTPFNPNIAGIKKRVLSLTVMSVSGLPAGKSSLASKLPAVCVTILYNGQRICKTETAAKSLDPRWDQFKNSDFISMIVPFILPQGELHAFRSAEIIGSPIVEISEDSSVTARQGLHFPLDPINNLKSVGKRPSSVKRGVLPSDILTIQVWDTSQGHHLQNGCEGILLGSVDVKGNDLADLFAISEGGGHRAFLPIYEPSNTPAIEKKSIFRKTQKLQSGDERRRTGTVELILIDNKDTVNNAEAGTIIHAAASRRKGPTQEFPMVALKQHRPVNRDTDLIIRILKARHLVANQNNKTKRNPYYIVWLNDRLIGRSAISRDTLSPRWKGDGEYFILPYEQMSRPRAHSTANRARSRTASMSGSFASTYGETVLRIELWDQLSSGGKEFLGNVVIAGDLYDIFDPNMAQNQKFDAASAVAEGNASGHWLPLQRSELIASHLQVSVGGEIDVTLKQPESSGGQVETEEPSPLEGIPVAFEITICSAENLSRADTFGLSDPFCIIKFDGAEIGRTSVLHKTTNPVWSGERFVVSMVLPESSDLVAGFQLPHDAALQVQIIFTYQWSYKILLIEFS